MRLAFDAAGWADYQRWQSNDRKLPKRANLLIEESLRAPGEGRGQPEHLKYRVSDVWSRRINQKQRLVYRFVNDDLVIPQAGFHFDGQAPE